jgi:hypothetical protein
MTMIVDTPAQSLSSTDAHRELVAFVLGAADLLGIEVCGIRADIGRSYQGGWEGDVAVHVSTDRTDFRVDVVLVDRLADYLGLAPRGRVDPTVYARETLFSEPFVPLGGFDVGVRVSVFCGRPGTEERRGAVAAAA